VCRQTIAIRLVAAHEDSMLWKVARVARELADKTSSRIALAIIYKLLIIKLRLDDFR
jgi:hypothetical protein